MKVKVKDLLANPHRRIKEYQIQPEKVRMLMNSINETFFWDNLIARPSPTNPGKFEIAYGHHRLEALKRLKIEEIDIPVKSLDDYVMLKIMADENAEEYSMMPSVLNETVLSVKAFLDKEIKEKDWGTLQQSLKRYFDKHNFERLQKEGVGETTIKEFLGENWSLRRIREALAALHAPAEEFDRKAAEKLKSIDAASTFRKAVKDYSIPKKEQAKLAEKLSEKGASAREVFREVRKARPKPERPKKDPLIERLENTIVDIEDKAKSLTNKIASFNAEARSLGTKEIGGLRAVFTVSAMSTLLREIKEYLTLFGYDYKNLQIGGK